VTLLLTVSATKLHGWQINECLAEGIIQHYTQLTTRQLYQSQIQGSLYRDIWNAYSNNPKHWDEALGDCFVWLLQNLREFKLSKPSWTWEQKMRQWIKDNYGFLDEDDQNKPITTLQPNSKRLSFEFWLKISFHMSPFPPDDSWITFGFCTCQNRMETSCMAEMYRRLIERCSFQNFWKAVHNSSMIQLLDLHGF
jgi:hypothetical protein